MMIPTPKITGVATSSTASRITRARDSPGCSPSRANACSITTTEPSTIRPIAIASPPSDIRFADRP